MQRPRPADGLAGILGRRQGTDQVFLVEITGLAGASPIRREWTVEAWRRRVRATAAWLAGRGVGHRGTVATLTTSPADILAVAFAAWTLGACVVVLDPAAEPVPEAASGAALLVRPGDALPDGTGTGIGPAPAADVPDHLALRLQTSGTGGEPVSVALTAANLTAAAAALTGGLGWDGTTTVLSALPVHVATGLLLGGLLPWLTGASTVLCDGFAADRFWAVAAAEGATVCSVVPAHLELLLDAPGAPPATLREVVCGGGPLLVDTVLDAEQSFGIPVRHHYGLTETAAVATAMPALPGAERRRWHRDFGFPAVGSALPGAQVAVVAADGLPQQPGLRGEIVVRGPVVAVGLAGDAGWLRTGDQGFWHEGPGGAPVFFVTGRIAELIERGTVTVSPFEVDEVLRSHPAVRDGVAVAFASSVYGQEVAAYVVADRPVAEEDILAHCARYLDVARCPKVVVLGDEIPHTALGKARRRELMAALAGRLAEFRDAEFRMVRHGGGPRTPVRVVPALPTGNAGFAEGAQP